MKLHEDLAGQLVDTKFADGWLCRHQTYLDNSDLTLTKKITKERKTECDSQSEIKHFDLIMNKLGYVLSLPRCWFLEKVHDILLTLHY